MDHYFRYRKSLRCNVDAYHFHNIALRTHLILRNVLRCQIAIICFIVKFRLAQNDRPGRTVLLLLLNLRQKYKGINNVRL